jgi:hypothetical protein
MAQRRTTRGAHALGDDRKKAGGWWKWLLAALLLVAAAILLVSLLSGGDDDKKADATPSTTASATGGAAGAASPGTLTGDGKSMLGSGNASLAGYVGTAAEGKAIKVLSVVDGEGFFVGTSAADSVYVEYGGAVGANEAARDYEAVVGDAVDLTGPVRPAPQDPAKTLKLGPEDAQLVSTEGAYVNATTVTKAG